MQVTHLRKAPQGLSWSPDGKWIAFSALVPETPPEIGKIPSPPEGAEWAEPAKIIDRLVYRYDGLGYLESGFVHIFVVPTEGGTARQISSGDFNHGGTPFDGTPIVWTPDSQSLIISAKRRDDADLEPLDSELFEFSVADGSVRALTERRGPDGSPAISPDGSQIAYLGFDDRYQGYQLTRIYVMDRDGRSSRLLSGELDRSVSSPRWSSSGKGIFVLYDDQGVTKIGHFDLDGKFRDVASGVGSNASAYEGGSFSLSDNGRIAMTYSDPAVPSDVAVTSVDGGELRVVTSVNADILAQRTLGEVEEIWYPSSHDQRKIHGWIIKPPHFDPNKKYPLILEIHGGPFANYGSRFDLEKQLMAAAGHVVLYTNPRGSTSYGEEFGNLIHHAYPGDDFYDLDAGVDAVIAKGYIDTDNLFVTGGSGGGVLTSWMIGRTDRFRAAVTVYPVINWYSWVLTADISSFGVKYWFPGFPWDYPEHYEKRSLLSVVKNVKTPTMVLTGEEDYRTPMSESEQYFQALQLLEVESVLVRVPGEPHGIRRRPSHFVQKIGLILGWFDKHRKEAIQPTS
jgi:acylaminoacyl-peptidase